MKVLETVSSNHLLRGEHGRLSMWSNEKPSYCNFFIIVRAIDKDEKHLIRLITLSITCLHDIIINYSIIN